MSRSFALVSFELNDKGLLDDWPKIMEDFGRVANMETMTFKNIELF
jgi:hypothetical protein